MKPGGIRERGYEAWVDQLRAENDELRMEVENYRFYVDFLESELGIR